MRLAEIAVLAAEALDAAQRALNADELERATACALVSLAATHYLTSARGGHLP